METQVVDIVDEILFEMIVLSSEVEIQDHRTSIIKIGVLSGFNNEVLNYFIMAGVDFMKNSNYEGFQRLYGEFLVASEKEDLAIQINNRAKQL